MRTEGTLYGGLTEGCGGRRTIYLVVSIILSSVNKLKGNLLFLPSRDKFGQQRYSLLYFQFHWPV